MSLVQLVYISRATFQPMVASQGVEPNVARILQQSRRNNPRDQIGGVLYYGDGCFFQCLEGEADKLDALLEALKKDDRHKDFRVIYRRPVDQRQFADWSMKYIPTSDTVQAFLRSQGMERFDPYRFDEATVRKLVDSLSAAEGDGGGKVRAQREGSGMLWISSAVLAVVAIVTFGLMAGFAS